MPVKTRVVRDPDGLMPDQIAPVISAPFGPKEQQLILKAFVDAAAHNTFDGATAAIDQWARKAWKAAGFPPFDELMTLDSLKKWGTPDARVSDRPCTPEWYAADILSRLRRARGYLKTGEASDDAAVEIFRLGLITAEAVLREYWKEDAIRGRKVRKGGQKGAAAKWRLERGERMIRDARFQLEAGKILKTSPELSASKLAKIIATKTGASASTIKKVLLREPTLSRRLPDR